VLSNAGAILRQREVTKEALEDYQEHSSVSLVFGFLRPPDFFVTHSAFAK
jgi:hypothetical protein